MLYFYFFLLLTFRGYSDLDSFLSALKKSGVEIKHGKQLAFRVPGTKKFIRQDTLGKDYSAIAILERLSDEFVLAPKPKLVRDTDVLDQNVKPREVNLLIDIEAKIQQGYGEGYVHWSKIENLKRSAKTLVYLEDVGLMNYDNLTQAAADSSALFWEISDKIKSTEKRMAEISELQKHIGQYGKTREVYKQYLNSKNREKFFDSLGYGKDKKLPPMDSLRQEYAKLSAGKGKLYSEYKAARQRMIEIKTAKHNTDILLFGSHQPSKIRERDTR